MAVHTELRALHAIDQKIRVLEKKAKDKESSLAREQAALTAAETALTRIRDDSKRLQMDVDRRNVGLRTAEDGRKKLESQLLTLRDNDEYKAMLRQIGGKGEEIGELEDKILESMDVVEKAKVAIVERSADVVAAKARLEEAKVLVAGERAAIDQQVAALREEWRTASGRVAPDVLELYQSVRDRRQGIGIALVGGDRICQGCYVGVTVQVLNRLVGGDVVQCNQCDRILCPTI